MTVPFVCACGRCPECAAGEQQVCRAQTQPGFTHWGSYAELVALDAADVNLVALPDGRDRAGELVPRHVRQRHVGVRALPGVPVRAADPGGLDADDDPAGRRRRVGQLAHLERAAVPLEQQAPHAPSSSARRSPIADSSSRSPTPSAAAAPGSSSAHRCSRP